MGKAALSYGIGFDTGDIKKADKRVDKSFESMESSAKGSAKASARAWTKSAKGISGSLDKVSKRAKKALGGIKKLAGADVTKALKRTALGVAAIGAAFAGIFAFGLKEAAEAERTIGEIAASARAAGVKDIPIFTASLSKLAAQLQRQTGVSQDVIQSNQAMAISLGVPADKIGTLTRAAVDMAAALNIDVKTAFEQLGRTASGELGRVGMFIPELKGISVAALKAGAGIDIAAAKFRGIAEGEANTLTVQLRILKEQTADLIETFVTSLTGTNDLKEGIKKLNEKMDDAFPIIENIGTALGESFGMAAEYAGGIKQLTEELLVFFGLSNNAPELAGGMADLSVETQRLATAEHERAGILKEIKKVEALQVTAKTGSFFDADVAEAKSKLGGGGLFLGRALAAGDKKIQELKETYRQLDEKVKGINGIVEELKGRSGELLEVTKDQLATTDGVAGALGKAGRSVDDLLAGTEKTSKKTKKILTLSEKISEATETRIGLQENLEGLEDRRLDIHRALFLKEIDSVDFAFRMAGVLSDQDTITKSLAASHTTITGLLEKQLQHGADINAELAKRPEVNILRITAAMGGIQDARDPKRKPRQSAFDLADATAAGSQAADEVAVIEREEEVEPFERIAELEGYAAALDAARSAKIALTNAEQLGLKSLAKQSAMTKTMTKVQGMFTGVLAQATRGFIQMAISGELSAKKLMHGVLSSLAQEAGVQAVFELAKGFGAYPDAAGMVSHFKSAALYGAVAVVAGAGAAATKPAEGGGGAAEGGRGGHGGGGGGFSDQDSRAEDIRETGSVREIHIVFNDGIFVGGNKEEFARDMAPMIQEAVAEAGGRDG